MNSRLSIAAPMTVHSIVSSIVFCFIISAAAAVSPWSHNLEVVSFLKLDDARHLELEGNRIYIGGGVGGIFDSGAYKIIVVDVANVEDPQVIGEYTGQGGIGDIAVEDAIVFVADVDNGLDVLDASQPSDIRLLDQTNGLSGSSLKVRNDIVFLGSQVDEIISIIDASNPADLDLLGTINNVSGAFDVQQNILLSPRRNATEGAVYNVSDPANPVLLGSTPGQITSSHNLIIEGSSAIIWSGFRRLDIHDISDPNQIRRIASYRSPSDTRGGGLGFSGGLLFAGSPWGIQVMDISRHGHPDFIRGSYFMPTGAIDLAVSGTLVYVADSGNGFSILRFVGPTPEACLNDAAVAEHNLPPTMTPGQLVEVTLSMRNTGTCVWNGMLGYKLAVLNDPGSLVDLPFPRINVPAGIRVGPEETFQFQFPLRAPQSTGSFSLELRMVEELEELFGEQFDWQIQVQTQPYGSDPQANAAYAWGSLE